MEPFVCSLSAEHKVIKNMALVDMRIVSYNQSVYVFIPVEGKWTMAQSVTGARFLANELGFSNVNVNYMAALEPYWGYVTRVAKDIKHMPQSVCIGTWRLTVTVERAVVRDLGDLRATPRGSRPSRRSPEFQVADDDESGGSDSGCQDIDDVPPDFVKFTPYGDIAPFAGFIPGAARISLFCVCPVRSTSIPKCASLKPSPSVAERILSNVLAREDLQLLMWVVGNGLIDPVSKPRSVLFYGPGSVGKTTTIRTISKCLRGTVHTLSQDYSSGTNPVSSEDAVGCMTSRFVCYGNMEFESDSINASVWRMITGGDTLTAQGMTSTVSCTGIFGSDHLWYPDAQTRMPWFMRRMIVIVMTPPPKGCAPPQTEFSDNEVTDFVCNAVATRLRCGVDPPLTLRHLLVTMFGYRVAEATRGVVERPDASDPECHSAILSLSIASLIDVDQLIKMAESMAPHMIKDIGYAKVIRGLTIRRVKSTVSYHPDHA
ncbi:uncharacterized protein UHOD_11439 [Ustilago sp. UG-2017b]|nr:uncharacterized protein UHOD_11439 [Ustilago sp. UG-2017b]